uniref:Uncharacterized protein n=1 Tax=Ditylenchus dipsaci TaxID=166011 RepID=A0A915CUH9_9BILA
MQPLKLHSAALLCYALIFSYLLLLCKKKTKKAVNGRNQSTLHTISPDFTGKEDAVNQPKRLAPNPKEEMIIKGMLIRGKNDYPTMDDVESDWEDSMTTKKKKQHQLAKEKQPESQLMQKEVQPITDGDKQKTEGGKHLAKEKEPITPEIKKEVQPQTDGEKQKTDAEKQTATSSPKRE